MAFRYCNINLLIYCNDLPSSLQNSRILLFADEASHCDLGVLLSCDPSWSQHYDHICANAYKSLGMLHRTFPNCHSNEGKKNLYVHNSQIQLQFPTLEPLSNQRNYYS